MKPEIKSKTAKYCKILQICLYMPGIQDGSEDFICLSSGILQQKPSAKAVFNRKASEHFRATEQSLPKKKCKISELVRICQDDSDTRQCRHHAFLSGCCRAGARHLYGRSITETHPMITRIPTTWCHHLSLWDLYRSI